MARNQFALRSPRQGQQGEIVVMFPIVLAVILTLAAFLLGVGVLFNSSVRLQNTANLASLAANEVFNKMAALPMSQRLKAVREAVDVVLEDNSITFLNESYNKSKIWDGTDTPETPETPEIKVGFWFYEKLSDCSLDTSSIYSGCDCPGGKTPCFIPVKEDDLKTITQSPNAMKVDIKPKSGSLKLPLGSMIYGTSGTDIQAGGISSVVERCTVFLLDVSTSGFASSHQYYGPNIYQKMLDYDDPEMFPTDPFVEDPTLPMPSEHPSYFCNDEWALYPKDPSDPDYPGYPIYELRAAYDFADFDEGDVIYSGAYAIPVSSSGTMSGFDCSVPISSCLMNKSTFDAYAQWCSMPDQRPATCANNPDPNLCYPHYRSDYEIEETVSGKFAIDKFTPPEPLKSVMMAANGGLREVQAKGTSTDKVAIIPFSHKIHGALPFEGLSRDLRFPVDMTDMRRGGERVLNGSKWKTKDKVSPNFIDRDWFPVKVFTSKNPPRAGTDILRALNVAVNRLTDSAVCSTEGRKSIILATDGIMTHTYPNSGLSVDWGSPSPIDNWSENLDAEAIMLDRNNPGSLLKRILDAKIRVTTLLTGDIVDPNFVNEVKSQGPPREFLSITELGSKGFRGFPNLSIVPPERGISKTDSELPWRLPEFARWDEDWNPTACNGSSPDYNVEECARKYGTQLPGFKYRRPNAIFAQLSILSGGLFCPLMEPYRNSDGTINEDCYDSVTGYWKDGNGNCSRDDDFQHFSVYGQERGGQAAECVRLTMGRPPYSLVVEPSS